MVTPGPTATPTELATTTPVPTPNPTPTQAANTIAEPFVCEDVQLLPCPSEEATFRVPIAGSPIALTFASGSGADAGVSAGVDLIGLGGWGVDVVHHLDTARGLLVLGDGRRRHVEPIATNDGTEDVLVVAADDVPELYVFDATGLHLRTLDAITGTLIRRNVWGPDGIAAVADADGVATIVERDATGAATAIQSAQGSRSQLGTLDGRLAAIVDPLGARWDVRYDPAGQLSVVRDPVGGRTEFGYDSEGRLARRDDPSGVSVAVERTQTPAGFALSWRTDLGKATHATVEAGPDGSMVRTFTDAAELTSELTVDGTSRVLRTPDGSITTVQLEPDPRWQMQAPVIAEQNTTSPAGRVQAVIRARTVAGDLSVLGPWTTEDRTTIDGATWTLTVNPASRRATMTDPLGVSQVWVTDELGHVVAIERSGLSTIAYTYDARGRVVAILEDPSLRTWNYAYDDQAGTITVTDPEGHINVARSDLAGRTTGLTLAGDRNLNVTWDPLGRLASLTPPGRQAHVIEHRPDGLPDAAYKPNGEMAVSMTTFDYDLDAALSHVTWSDDAANLQRDESGRLTSVGDASGDSLVGYDSAGLPQMLETSDVSEQIDYDGPAPVSLAWSGLVSGSLDRQLDGRGRIVSESLTGGPAIEYEYDQAGRLAIAGDLTLQRDGQTGLVSQESLGALTTVRSYDDRGLLIGLEIGNGTSTAYQLDISRDGLGRVIERAETVDGTTTTYSYTRDQAGRLAAVTVDGSPSATYTYDPNGNLTVATGASAAEAIFDSRDALIQRGDATYTYDGRGRLSSVTAPDGISQLTYDVAGALATVTKPDSATVAYANDALGRRVTKSVGGSLVSGWLYGEGQRVIAELDAAGNVASRFVYGDDETAAPAYMVKGGTTYLFVADDLGSVRLVVDASTGEVAQRLDYDAWGVVVADSAPGFQPFGFAGGIYDADTGLVRFGARDYDAKAGRWTAPDPIGFAGGDPNLYAYAFNDPSSLTDRTGLCTVETAGYAVSGYWGIGGTLGAGFAYANGEWHPYFTAGYGAGSPSYGAEATYGCSVDGEGDPFDIARGWNNGWTWGMGPFSVGKDYSIPNRVGTTGDATSHGNHYAVGPEIDPPHFEFETTRTWVWGCWFGCSDPPPADSGKPDGNRGKEKAGVCAESTSCEDTLGDELDKQNQSLVPCDVNCGSSWGDPHLVTLDGLKYDFQAAGEFVLVDSQTDDLEIQVRQETYGAINSIAFDTAVAMNVNGDRVGLYEGGPDQLLVNGVETSLDSSLDLPGGGRIEAVPAGLVINWPDGSRVVLAGGPNSVFVDLAEARAGNVTGLLGNFDGDDANDLTSSDGTLVEAAKADFNHPLYAVFGNSWRVEQPVSLFDDLPGQDVARYQRLDVPSAAANAADLPADVRAAAESACKRLGITDPSVLESCILDLGTTGDLAFALSAQQADAALTKPAAEPAGGDQISVTVTVNGQPATTGGRLAVQAFTQADPAVLVATSFENPGVLVVPAGTYDVLVEYRAAWEQRNVNGTIKTWLRDVAVGDGANASRSLDLELGSATVEVTEAAGKPLDLSVFGMRLRALDDERVMDLFALGTERATFDLPPGSYEVTVDYAGTSLQGDGPVATFTVVAEQTTTESVDLQLGRLQVRVLDDSGSPVPADQLLVMRVFPSDRPDRAFHQAFAANPGDLIVPGDTPFDVVVTLDGERRGWVAHRNAQQVAPGQTLTVDIPISEFAPP